MRRQYKKIVKSKFLSQMNATLALGDIGVVRTVDRLLQGLQKNIRPQAIQALGKIGDKRAEKPLFEVLE